jgi:hypothetical protein
MPITTKPRARWRCTKCGQLTAVRLLSLQGISVNTARIGYQNRFPYESNAFPFKGKGARHVGPMGKCLVENAYHESKLRDIHGYVGESR